MKVAIIGAGIGGLTTAIALKQAGIDTEIFEAAPELKPVGAGIFMWSNAMQVFHQLGISDEVKTAGLEVEMAWVKDQQLHPITTYHIKEKISNRFGIGNFAMTRARLQEVLLRHIKPELLHLQKRLRHLDLQPDQVRLSFEDGTIHDAEIVIAADGIHSVARKFIDGTCPPRFSGQTCWRGISHFRLPDEFRNQSFEIWGDGAGLRFGFGQVWENEVYWFSTVCTPEGQKDQPGRTMELLQKLYADFGTVVTGLINCTDPLSINRSDLYDFPRIRHWWKGRLALLGDAAHATTPNLGQGGCQAIEDGWAVAHYLKQYPDPQKAFSAYQQYRYAKAKKVIDLSWTMNRFTNIKPAWLRTLRNAMLRSIPESVNIKMLNSIYQLDPL
jgi:2-polyprenyl-6-methoxyphenol hydroxylase-like FAD-dependent oxidoreductase